MSYGVFVGLVQNLTLILALAFLYGYIKRGLVQRGLSAPIAVGFLFGIIAIGCMLRPVELVPGVFIDGRTIMLSLAAPFAGAVAGLIASGMVLVYRLWLGFLAYKGGVLYAVEGVYAGLIALVLVTLIGYIALRIQRRRGRPFTAFEFYILGLIGSIAPISGAFGLPMPVPFELLSRTLVPLLVTIPLGTFFLAVLLRDQDKLFQDREALQDSEMRYRLLAENASDIISVFGADGRWVYASPALYAVLGYEAAEVEGHFPHEFLHPDEDETCKGILRPDGPDTATLVCRWRHKNGRYVWCETTIRRVKDQATGVLREITAATRNISERKRYEMDLEDSRAQLSAHAEALKRINEDLRLSKEMADAANRAKSRFLAAASHDLRQPFQAMRLFHHLLIGNPSPEKRQDIVARLGDAMTVGEELLNALLDISILEAGRVTPNVTTVSLKELLEEMAEQFQPVAAEKGLTLRLGPHEGAVRTDVVLLKRMLQNLITNAIRYTDHGGILIGCRQRGGACRIEVWDTGAGIPSDQIDTIFEDFYQIGNPERDRRQGLGLGLSIVQRTARLLGHDIIVRSQLGKGSLFAIILPFAEPVTDRVGQEQAIEIISTASLPAIRILIVEDDAIQLVGLRMLVESWGYEVRVSSSSEAALKMLSEVAPLSAVISDFRLPGDLTGAQLILRIREQLGWTVPGIIVTGDTDPARLREASAADCRLIHKPYNPVYLRQAVQDALAGGTGKNTGPRLVSSR